jgi:glycerol kinase
MAGIRSDFWSEQHALSRLITEADVFAPATGAAQRNRLVAGWRSAIDQTMAGACGTARYDA